MPSETAPSGKEELAWLAIRDNGRLALDFVGQADAAALDADTMRLYAAVRCLEIMSEAARRLRGAQQARFSHLPWRDMEDAGNVYRHVYDKLSTSRILATIRNHVPAMIEAAMAAVGDEPA